ncbi:O-antigen polymerase [Prevotella sp. HUN102]|uniref:O-antigen polymerase n=1 Tax=Prevotella sp. HUN102 TaxID=1392486 RepID=UPI000490A483|nr:O-antigen polymerase [Prevotella sp. HUN102]
MSEALLNNILAIGFLSVWVITLICYQFRRNIWDGGSAIITAYIIYAIFSILSLNDPLFSIAYNPLKVFPYIYLYLMMMIALTPLIVVHYRPTSTIQPIYTRILGFISVIILLSTILMIPGIMKDSANLVDIVADPSAGKEAYMEKIEGVETSGSAIRNLPAIIFNSLSDIAIFIFFYYLTLEKKNKFFLFCLSAGIIANFIVAITQGQRSGVALAVFTIIGGYMLFKQYIQAKIKKIFSIIGIAAAILIAIPFTAITVSRFGEDSDASGTIEGFISWYVGQGSLYFNNFGLDAGGTRNGDRTANLIKRIIDPKTPKNFMERRDKYHNLNIDDHFFTTFVGDFTIDYGPVYTVVIFIMFNLLIIVLTRTRGSSIKLRQLLLLYFVLCINMQGGMYLFSYSDIGGNLRIINFILLYTYLLYHEKLEDTFPKEATAITKKE